MAAYNKVTMNTMRSTLRFLIAASLLLCLSTLSVFPRVMVGQVLGTMAPASTGASDKYCCCGTEDGRCCGMACCQTSPNPLEKQGPEAPRSSEDRGQTFGLPTNAGALLGREAASAAGQHFSQHPASLGGSSLITLSIRLNI
jgi:hypothetical protein